MFTTLIIGLIAYGGVFVRIAEGSIRDLLSGSDVR